jgi:hypothetical protein
MMIYPTRAITQIIPKNSLKPAGSEEFVRVDWFLEIDFSITLSVFPPGFLWFLTELV